MSHRPPDGSGINPEMVILARESRGLTQRDAAEGLGIAQGTLSKIETGLTEPTADVIMRMTEYFAYPEGFFTVRQPLPGPTASEFFHRKKQATGVKVLRRLHAEINVRLINIMGLLRAVELPEDRIPRIDIDEGSGVSPEDVAREVRALWSLPPGPVTDLVGAIESAGGIVVLLDFGTNQVDALNRYIPGMPRVFFLNTRMPADRQRLSLAHELGHVVMHQCPDDDIEREANRFAAEFLMPEADVGQYLRRVDLATLYKLKPYWRVSMAALLKRACDLGWVSPSAQKYMWIQMAPYRTKEPSEIDISAESPHVIAETLRLHQEEFGYSLGDLSRVMLMSEDEIQRVYGVTPTRADMKLRLRAVTPDRTA